MLSEHHRRALQDIEQRLEREDAAFAATLRGQEGVELWARRRHDATIAVATLLAIVCLALPGAGGSGLVAAALAIIVFAVRRKRFTRPRRSVLEQLGQPGRGMTGWRPGRRPPV